MRVRPADDLRLQAIALWIAAQHELRQLGSALSEPQARRLTHLNTDIGGHLKKRSRRLERELALLFDIARVIRTRNTDAEANINRSHRVAT